MSNESNTQPGGITAAAVGTLAATEMQKVPETDDPLAEALHYLRMDGMFYCRSELTAPWGVDLPPMPDCLWFHVVTEGECELTAASGQKLALRAGDIAVLPHGTGHCAVDVDGSVTPLVFDLPHHYVSRQYAILRHGGGGASANIICGVVQLGHPAARALLAMLPEIIHIDSEARESQWQWLPGVLSLIAAESQTTRPGGETIVTRLCDVLVIQAIRFWIENDPAAQLGWLGALRDPVVGQAIARVHADPSQNWTVAALAREVGMSRSGFSARFSELVGQSPKQYVTSWRMQIAEDVLRRESMPMLELAAQLGYQSEAAFSRAFKREVGVAPSRVRPRQDLLATAQTFAAPPT